MTTDRDKLREHGQYEAFIHAFTEECSELSEEIVSKIVKRTIKRFNENMDSYLFGDDYPHHFTPFDCYSIFWYEEWGGWELRDQIRDCIENFLELEYDNLTKPEQLVLDYAFINDEFNMSHTIVLKELYDYFMAEVEVHLQLKKIQEFLYRI